jgi:ATP dependent DNA ligase domain
MPRHSNPLPAPGMAQSAAPRSRGDSPALPEWIRPQLTQLVDAAPDGNQWLHEIKYDGFRMHARLDHGDVRLLTRNGLDWTNKYPQIAAAVAALPARQAYLDGELCGVRPDGITSFSMIPAGVGRRQRRRPGVLPVRSSLSRRRGSHRTAADRAQGNGLPAYCRRRDRPCNTAITRPGLARPFTKKPVPWVSKVSSRNAPIRNPSLRRPEIKKAPCGGHDACFCESGVVGDHIPQGRALA